MSFIDEARATVVQESRCGVAKWLATQEDVTDSEIREAGVMYSAAAAHKAMVARGFRLARGSVERHLSGKCSCPVS